MGFEGPERSVVRFEISEPLAVCISVCVVAVAFSTALVGGCAVNGHYKAEAVRAMHPEKHEFHDGIGPKFAEWKVVQKSDRRIK